MFIQSNVQGGAVTGAKPWAAPRGKVDLPKIHVSYNKFYKTFPSIHVVS
jgi:hypothetical protein